jgi:hypothetical protein
VDSARSMQDCAVHQQYREPLYLLQDKIFGARFQASDASSMSLMLVWVVTLRDSPEERRSQNFHYFLLFIVTYVTLFGSYGKDGYANAPQYYVIRILHILLK